MGIALVKLGADTVQVVQQWTVLAVNGAELPVAQQRPARAQRLMAAGMTMDVAFVMPAQDRYAIRVRMLACEVAGFAGSSVLIPLVSTSVSDKR
ncbi:hypothetical protein [Gemmatimonas sp.]|uniref:hypothetical protein n=1 Tax=Gemmatimonas sp. TaxID=1962908 RepID=UPI003567584A